MSVEFHRRVREAFDRAMEQPQAERLQFAEGDCGSDSVLYEAVKRLLVVQSESEGFMRTDSSPVKRMGRYIIHSELGRGGMGVVYDAMDPVIGRGIALKVISLAEGAAADEAELMREQLFREARSCGRLTHPGIVIIFDVGQEDKTAFIAMERVDGPSLHRLLSSGQRLPVKESLRILRETAAALDYAHQHGIVHRDIKPANIMLNKERAVKVADFGIAKIISGQRTTVTSVVMGTPSYMSPEQIEGKRVDGRSDQFSLAILAYELLAGERPFRADSVPTIAHLIVYGARPSPRTMNAELPEGVDAVFQRALARVTDDRFQTCTEFISTLATVIESGSQVAAQVPPTQIPAAQASIPSLPQVPVKPTVPNVEGSRKKRTEERSRALTVFFALTITLLAVGAGAYYWVHYRHDAVSGSLPANQIPEPPSKTGAEITQTPSKPPGSGAPGVIPAAESGPPTIKKFSIDTSIKSGSPAMLVWDVANADQVSIDHDVGKVGAKGMSAVVPLASTTYTLTAASRAGVRTAKASVEVEPESVPVAVRIRELMSEAEAKRKDRQPAEAIRLYTQAAGLGDTNAMIQLGEGYSSGEGVPQDDKTALIWFRKAAEAGNTAGMVLLGGLYELGVDGAEPDDELAVQWFQKAADRDNPLGLYNLGTLYENGSGVPRNLEKAKALYEKAGNLGNTEAQKRLAQLKTQK